MLGGSLVEYLTGVQQITYHVMGGKDYSVGGHVSVGGLMHLVPYLNLALLIVKKWDNGIIVHSSYILKSPIPSFV